MHDLDQHSSAAGKPYAELRRQLESGVFAPGARLPTLRSLAAELRVPLRTVHQAIIRLQHEGFVTSRQGSGSYATDRKSKTRTVLLLNRTAGDEWSDLTRVFTERFSAERDTRLLIEAVPNVAPDRVVAFRSKLAEVLEAGVDVVLFNGLEDTGTGGVMDLLRASGVRSICFYAREVLRDFACGFVVSDWRRGGYAGMRHLMEIGKRDVLLLLPPGASQVPHHYRAEFLAGCEEAVADSVHEVRIRQMVTHVNEEPPEPRIMELFKGTSRPDAVFASADFRVAPLVGLLQRSGLRVPEDVALLGYYDTPWTMMTDPRLSSISTRCQDIANAVSDMCTQGRFNEQIVISPKLIIRASSAL